MAPDRDVYHCPGLSTYSFGIGTGSTCSLSSKASRPVVEFDARVDRANTESNGERAYPIHLEERPGVNPTIMLSPLGAFPSRSPLIVGTQVHQLIDRDLVVEDGYFDGTSFQPNRRALDGGVLLGHMQSLRPPNHTQTVHYVWDRDIQHTPTTAKRGTPRRVISVPIKIIVNLCRMFRGFF